MWAKISGVLLLITSFLGAMFYREKAGRTEDKLKASEDTRAKEQKATEALLKGLEREDKTVADALARRRIK